MQAFSVFLGWVRSVSGSVWATSVAHGSNIPRRQSASAGLHGPPRRHPGRLRDPAVLIGEALTAEMLRRWAAPGERALGPTQGMSAADYGIEWSPVVLLLSSVFH